MHRQDMNKITGFDGDIDDNGDEDSKGDGEYVWSSNTRKQQSIGSDVIEEVLVHGNSIDDNMGDTNSSLVAKYDALKALENVEEEIQYEGSWNN